MDMEYVSNLPGENKRRYLENVNLQATISICHSLSSIPSRRRGDQIFHKPIHRMRHVRYHIFANDTAFSC